MSEKNSAMLKTPYTTQYVSHVVSSSLLELSMALMLRQERGRVLLPAVLLPGRAPPSQVLQTLEQTCLPGTAAPSWDSARSQRFQEGLKSFPTITACSFTGETLI